MASHHLHLLSLIKNRLVINLAVKLKILCWVREEERVGISHIYGLMLDAVFLKKLLDYLWYCAVSHSSLDEKCLSRKKTVCFNACLKKYEACHQQIALQIDPSPEKTVLLQLSKAILASCKEHGHEFKQVPQKTLDVQNSS